MPKDHLIGQRIADLLEQHELSQADLAEKASVTRAAISQIVNGNRIPTIPVLMKIAKVLSVSIDYLAGQSKKSNVSAVIENDPGQFKFFRDFQKLDPKIQAVIQQQVEAMSKKK